MTHEQKRLLGPERVRKSSRPNRVKADFYFLRNEQVIGEIIR